MSVTVKNNQFEEQEDFNSTSENILDDDALYEQNDFEESDIESEAESGTRSAASGVGSYNSLMQQLNTESIALGLAGYISPVASRQSSPRRPVESDTESDAESTTNQSVKRPIATRQRTQQHTTPTELVEILDEATINNMEGRMRQALPMPSAPQAPSNPTYQLSATTDQGGNENQESSIEKNHSWSEESSATKTKDNRIRVSYNREETFEQENGDKHVTAESYVKHYSETEYKKKGK